MKSLLVDLELNGRINLWKYLNNYFRPVATNTALILIVPDNLTYLYLERATFIKRVLPKLKRWGKGRGHLLLCTCLPDWFSKVWQVVKVALHW